MKRYLQCQLRKGAFRKTGWVEERGAKVGVAVELLPDRERWEVVGVFGPSLPEDMLREHQRLNRGSLPSVERMV